MMFQRLTCQQCALVQHSVIVGVLLELAFVEQSPGSFVWSGAPAVQYVYFMM